MFLWKSRRNHSSHVSAPNLHIPALLMTLFRSMMQGNNVWNYAMETMELWMLNLSTIFGGGVGPTTTC